MSAVPLIESPTGPAAVLLLDSGMLQHAGAYVFWDPQPLPRWMNDSLGPFLAESGVRPGDLLGVLELSLFARLMALGGSEQDQHARGALLDISAFYYRLPILKNGRIAVGPEDAVPIMMPDVRLGKCMDQQMATSLATGQKAFLLAALFSLSCFNALMAEKGNHDYIKGLTPAGEDGLGPVVTCEMKDLKDDLNLRSRIHKRGLKAGISADGVRINRPIRLPRGWSTAHGEAEVPIAPKKKKRTRYRRPKWK